MPETLVNPESQCHRTCTDTSLRCSGRSLDCGGGVCYDESMKVVSGKVVDGRIVVEGEPLEEGCTVTVLAPERDEAFVLDAEAQAALLAAIGEADRGETISSEQLLDELREPA